MMEFFKESKVNTFFSKYANDLIFISISPAKLKSDFGIEEVDFMLPVKKSQIISMAKQEYQELKTSEIIEGILVILGSDYQFKFNKSYVKILELKVPELEKTIKSFIVSDIKSKKLMDAALKLRAYIGFINPMGLDALSYYASACKEIFVTSKDKKSMMIFLEEAKNSFEKVITLDPKNPLAIYELSYIYTNEGELEKAKTLLETGVEVIEDELILSDALNLLNSLNLEHKLVEVQELLEENKIKEALKILHKLEGKTQTQKYRILFDKGYCYKMLGDADMALECYEEAVLINNMDPRLLAEIGLIYGYLGDYEQSLEFYFSALNLDAKSIAILCNLSMLLMNTGDFDRAREYLDRAMEIDDKDDIVIACLKELRKYE